MNAVLTGGWRSPAPNCFWVATKCDVTAVVALRGMRLLSASPADYQWTASRSLRELMSSMRC